MPLDGIVGLTGGNGSGKTNLAMKWIRQIQKRGDYPLYSTAGVGKPLESWADVLAVKKGILFLDEIHAVLGSREWQGLPTDVAAAFMQWRKRDVLLIWTSPSDESVDVVVRRVTPVILELRPIISVRGEGLWPRTVLSNVWRGEKLVGFHRIRKDLRYDTGREVSAWGIQRCGTCGKPDKPGPKFCTCPPSRLDDRTIKQAGERRAPRCGGVAGKDTGVDSPDDPRVSGVDAVRNIARRVGGLNLDGTRRRITELS